MTYWTRELAGWLLLALGLLTFYRSYSLLTADNHYVLEGSSLTVVGIFLFRGGIHLLKIAVAARVCTQAHERMESKLVRTPAPTRPMPSRRSTFS